MSALASLRKLLLSNQFVRRRIAFDIKQYYFDDLELSLPLGCGLQCPIAFADAGWSFREIFLELEYGPAFTEMPLPRRWLDLGCHAGYFSLWLLWKRLSDGLDDQVQALLVDADGRLQQPVVRMIALNRLESKFKFAQGLLSASHGAGEFFQRQSMGSSSVAGVDGSRSVLVPILDASAIKSLLAPPYDLIKIDVEGAEFDLLENYGELFSEAASLVLEWHSWHRGGGGEQQIIDMASRLGFELSKRIGEARPVEWAGKQEQTGTHLYRRR